MATLADTFKHAFVADAISTGGASDAPGTASSGDGCLPRWAVHTPTCRALAGLALTPAASRDFRRSPCRL